MIVGGESGFNAKAIQEFWVLNIKNNVKSKVLPFSLNNGELTEMMALNATKNKMELCLMVDYIGNTLNIKEIIK